MCDRDLDQEKSIYAKNTKTSMWMWCEVSKLPKESECNLSDTCEERGSEG